MNKKFGQEFKQRRIDAGFKTSLDMAKYCSASKAIDRYKYLIDAFEQGECKNISVYEAFSIAEALNIDDDALVDLELKEKATP